MVIHIGLEEIKLVPIGTMLVGSRGRVDVVGRAGTSRLLLVNKKVTSPSQLISVTIVNPKNPPPAKRADLPPIEWAWKIASRPPTMTFIELNKSLFADVAGSQQCLGFRFLIAMSMSLILHCIIPMLKVPYVIILARMHLRTQSRKARERESLLLRTIAEGNRCEIWPLPPLELSRRTSCPIQSAVPVIPQLLHKGRNR
jgi:hypothetical protein